VQESQICCDASSLEITASSALQLHNKCQQSTDKQIMRSLFLLLVVVQHSVALHHVVKGAFIGMSCIKFFFKVTKVDKDGRSKSGHSSIIFEAHIDRRLSSMQRERYTSLIVAIKKAFPELKEKNFNLVSTGINIF